MEVGKLYWWWCVYFLIFNLLIELSSHLRLSFSLSSNSDGVKSCQQAGSKHRPYSSLRVYFLTSTNPQSCLIYLTGYDGGLATIGEGSWYVYRWWFVYFLIFNLLIELSSHLRLSFSLSSNSDGVKSCYHAGEHRLYSYIRLYFLTSTNPQSCLTIWQVEIVEVLPLAMEVGKLYWWWCLLSHL